MIEKDEQERQCLLELIPGLAMSMGIVKALHKQNNQQVLSHMPITLYPYTLKESTYKRLIRMQTIWQQLIIKVANNEQFLLNFLKKISVHDDFMRKLEEIYIENKNILKNQYQVACSRVDYMGDDHPQLVQLNLISIGLLGISDRVQSLTKILKTNNCTQNKPIQYPENRNAELFSQSIKQCLDMNQYTDGYILMVVLPKQFNYGDQNAFKLEMKKQGRNVITATLEELLNQLVISQNKQASFRGKKINCFYFRSTYSPNHYPNQQYWDLRRKIQSSKSIKVPSIQLLIVNSKSMQAQFHKKQVLQKYLKQEEVQEVMSLTSQIYALQDYDYQYLKQLLLKMDTKDYVLKPNRQGGGNNYFGEDAKKKLVELIGTQERSGYIVMNKIKSRQEPNVFISQFKSKDIPAATGQFSMFGSFIYKQGQIIKNIFSGTLVRLKQAHYDEGGITINKAAIAGFAITLKQ